MRNTKSSRKQASRCAVGIVIINAKRSSINVLNAYSFENSKIGIFLHLRFLPYT